MKATTSDFVEQHTDSAPSGGGVETLLPPDSQEPSDIDISEVDTDDVQADVHIEGIDSANHTNPRATRTTDLVRLYLQEIGRVSLLERDEEVAEAQLVQQHMDLLKLRNEKAAEEEGGTLAVYVHLLDTQDQLKAQLSHRPSLERWAKTAEIDVAQLKPTLVEGKRLWAALANISVEELKNIQKEGARAKEQIGRAHV